MSLLLRRIALENFRKFRAPHEIAGLTDGLNVVIEPNETGKSTLLEAVRAGLFLKHNSKTQLITSFQPHGDEVGPEITLDFEVDGAAYALKKRFISRAMAELSGPRGRSQGSEAEDALQRLLGFEQGRGFDTGMAGALGMLWVSQMDGLSVTPPGERVRDLIGATLQGEAGTILGSAAFERVRGRVEGQFREYLTATGRPTGRYTAAQQRATAAAAALSEAQQKEAALEAAFDDLAKVRAQLTTLRRELEDDHDAEERAALLARLDTARSAAQQLATRQAEAIGAAGRLAALEDLAARGSQALNRKTGAQTRRDKAQAERGALSARLGEARGKAAQAGEALTAARTARSDARTALVEARTLNAARQLREAVTAAHERHAGILALEAERKALEGSAAHRVPAEVLADLEAGEREAIRHRTLLEADGTRVELVGPAASLTRDGAPMTPGEWTLTRETRIGLPGGGELVLRPSQALAGAQAALDKAVARQAALLAQWQLESLAQGHARNEAAREAQRGAETLAARIAAAAPVDRDLGLLAGADALKVFVAAHPLTDAGENAETRPVADLEQVAETRETAYARAEAFLKQADDDLRAAEKAETPLAIDEQTALNDLAGIADELARLAAHPDFATLDSALPAAREAGATASVELEKARINAQAFDEDALRRRIDMLAARRKAAEDSRGELTNRIAALEAKVESEGGKGLAEHAAAAREEDLAARAALVRIEEEAETLRLLRDTLGEAQTETARTITGPVAARAARYVGRILPGGEPAFGEDLGLAAIRRGGTDEACEQLSRGTQEQLAILTRLAFADMLLEEGRPVSLILDDPLVYADDTRLDAMIELIVEASQRMQVILLTCRERAFRHVPGNRIRL